MLLEPWLALWRLGAAASWGTLAAFAQLADPRPARAFWSRTLSQAADRTMRSPAFLDLMAGNLRVMANVTRLGSALQFR